MSIDYMQMRHIVTIPFMSVKRISQPSVFISKNFTGVSPENEKETRFLTKGKPLLQLP